MTSCPSRPDPQGNSTLTPDDKGRLAANFKGYDISPDMVRLSLVNLYLHGFNDPHIFEYDTLTSEERWNEYADVILANPPFMSPKGGIRPHNRFSVQSKRSEVLFVDYMAEHLMPSGPAWGAAWDDWQLGLGDLGVFVSICPLTGEHKTRTFVLRRMDRFCNGSR